MIEFLFAVIKWLLILFFALPVMFLFGVRAFDQWVRGDFHWEGWDRVRRR